MTKDEGIITLQANTGEELEFYEVAEIAYNEQLYVILQPVELLEGMEEDEALVFLVTDDEDGMSRFDIVDEDEVIDAVFEIYNKLLDEQK